MNIPDNMIRTSIKNFHLNKNPIANTAPLFNKTSGKAPSRVPAGQRYLQKNGMPDPLSSLMISGNNITRKIRTGYFIYLNILSAFSGTFNFGTGIIYKSSSIRPKRQSQPQINLPKRTPTAARNPMIKAGNLLFLPAKKFCMDPIGHAKRAPGQE